jgi:hypothetical protein
MISSDGIADTTTIFLNPVSAADTAAATSAWIDMGHKKGNIVIIQSTGALTGSLASIIQGSTAANGANPVTLATFTAVSAANKCHSVTVDARHYRYLHYVGTVTTGPIVIGVCALSHPGLTA